MNRAIAILLFLSACDHAASLPPAAPGAVVMLGAEPHCAGNAMVPIPPPTIRTASQIAAYADRQNAAREEEHAARNDCANKLHDLWMQLQALRIAGPG